MNTIFLIIAEGIVMCFFLLMYCVMGISAGPVGLVVLYEQDVQDRVVQLGYTTNKKQLYYQLCCFIPSGVYCCPCHGLFF